MKKLIVLLVLTGMLISAGGCRDRAEVSEQQKEKLLYETIAELVEIDKTRMNKVIYNFSVEDIGMTKGQAIKMFGFPDHVNCTYHKGLFWGIYKHTQWKYQNGMCLYFENGILTSWQN